MKNKKQLTKIELKRLSKAFYQENSHLYEMIDKSRESGKIEDKGRGYGVILVPIQNLTFAIPFRSNMSHSFGFVSHRAHKPDGSVIKSGLDYTKAVVITEERYLETRLFKLRTSKEYWNVVYNEEQIVEEFESYIEKYISAVRENDEHILNDYRWSTLKNYHVELGLQKKERSL